MAMSWFERRQQAAKLEAEAEPAVVSVLDTAPEPRAAGGAAACSAADDAAYVATQRAAADAPLFDEDACATRVLSCDSEQGARACVYPSCRLLPLAAAGCWLLAAGCWLLAAAAMQSHD